jgi:hypothetical protein
MESRNAFPLNSALWQGCVLASIAHAVFLCRAPLLAHERSWNGSTYGVTDSQGTRGAIVFGEDRQQFIAAFFAEHSSRNPFGRAGTAGIADAGLLERIPQELKALASALFAEQSSGDPFVRAGAADNVATELLERLPRELKPLASALPPLTFDDQGAAATLATSIFWSGLSDMYATSCEPWGDVFNNGASLVECELLGEQAALAALAADMALRDAEIGFVASVYRRRLANALGEVMLTHQEAEQLGHISRDVQGIHGIHACKKAFTEIGILFPVA